MSKCGVTWHSNLRVDLNNDPKVCLKMLETSLTDLKSDYLDAYFIHHPDPRTDIRKTMEVLAKAKMQQKIRYIGLSNTNEEEYKLASEVEKVDVLQQKYHFFHRGRANEMESKYPEVSLISYGTFDQGVLTQRVDLERKFEKNDHRSFAPSWKKRSLEREVQRVAKLKNVLNHEPFDLLDLAIGTAVNHQSIISSLVGLKSQEGLEQVLMALRNLPSTVKIEELEKSFNEE